MNDSNRVHLEYERLRGEAKARADEAIARWRRDFRLRMGHEARCSDRVAFELAEMAASVGRLP